MKNKGFTLIELLAVIVILAIIALIATPIILNIISDSKEEANKRSVELYGKAVEQAIAKSQLNGIEIPVGDLSEEFLKTVQYSGSKVTCTTNKLYADGSIYLAGCNGEYTYGTQKIEIGKMSSVCTPVEVATQGIYTSGDKYECKVDPNKEAYIFYVLSSTNDSVNLIMASNITSAGEAVDGSQTQGSGLVAWNSTGYNSEGPITAMNFLAETTKNWTNLTPMTYIYDEITENPGDYGYNKLEINNGEGKVYAKGSTEGTTISLKEGITATVRARIATIGEINTVVTNNANTMPTWLYENLAKPPYAYWTLSSQSFNPVYAWCVESRGVVINSDIVDTDYYCGARPVITLSI